MRLISIILLFSFVSNIVFADSSPSPSPGPAPACDWTTIKSLPNGDYEISPALSVCIGNLVQNNQVQAQQIQDLTQAISLKSLALQQSDTRANLWMNTADSELTKLQKLDSDQRVNEWLYFGIGVLVTGVAAYSMAKLTGH